MTPLPEAVPAPSTGAWATARGRVEQWGLLTLLRTSWLRGLLAKRRAAPIDGRTLDEDFAAMLALDDLTGRSDLRRLSPARAREHVATDVRVVDQRAEPGVTRIDRQLPGPAGLVRTRFFQPEALDGVSPAVVYIHGGGWVTGSIETHDAFCARLAAGAGCRVVSPEYRLAPEHRYPAAVDDTVAVTRWVLENAENLRIDPRRVAVAGDSAGGNLSAVVARRTGGDPRKLALQVLLYPALDGTCASASYRTLADGYFLTRAMCDWYYEHYVGGGDRRDPDVSPLLAPDVSDVPALIYTAGFDPLRDEGRAYADRLMKAGTRVHHREFADLVHGFVLMRAASSSGRNASEAVIADIRRELFR